MKGLPINPSCPTTPPSHHPQIPLFLTYYKQCHLNDVTGGKVTLSLNSTKALRPLCYFVLVLDDRAHYSRALPKNLCFFSAQRAHWIVADFGNNSSFQEIKKHIYPAMFFFVALINFF